MAPAEYPLPPVIIEKVAAFREARDMWVRLTWRRARPLTIFPLAESLERAGRASRDVVAALRDHLLAEANLMLEGTGTLVFARDDWFENGGLKRSPDLGTWNCICGGKANRPVLADQAVADAAAHAAVVHAETYTPGCETDRTGWTLTFLAAQARGEHRRLWEQHLADLVARGDATDRELEEARAEIMAVTIENALRRDYGSAWAHRWGR